MCRSSSATGATAPEPPNTRYARLTLIQGVGAGTCFRISNPITTLGRHSGCDIVLDHPTVSRHHTAVHSHEDGFTVVDAGSANGTYLNDRQVKLADITHGDQLTVGPFRFQFEIVG
jgi:pSer/pThr/pTyr-binding forkhead associated (FHA) protein